MVAKALEGVPYRLAQPRAAMVIESNYQLRPGPADLQLLVGSCRLRGIAYVYVRLERSYITLDSMCTLSCFVSYRRLSPTFQFFLSAVTLGIYLGGYN